MYTLHPVVAYNENHKYTAKVCHTGDKESRLSATMGMTKTNELYSRRRNIFPHAGVSPFSLFSLFSLLTSRCLPLSPWRGYTPLLHTQYINIGFTYFSVSRGSFTCQSRARACEHTLVIFGAMEKSSAIIKSARELSDGKDRIFDDSGEKAPSLPDTPKRWSC